MGRKIHPTGFRLGIVKDWQSKWYTDKHYVEYLREDMAIRKAIKGRYGDAGVSLVEIERPANKIIVTIHTARPGIVIGRGGQRVDETRRTLEELIGKKLQLNVQEIRQPELDAYLVARSLAEQIERRVAYRRAMKQAIFRSMQAGAQGIKINCAGRLGGVEIARAQVMHQGRVPLHTLRADVDYGFTEAHTIMGRIGIKVWLYRGDVLPEQEEEMQNMEAEPPAPVEKKPEEAVATAAITQKETAAETSGEKAEGTGVAAASDGSGVSVDESVATPGEGTGEVKAKAGAEQAIDESKEVKKEAPKRRRKTSTEKQAEKAESASAVEDKKEGEGGAPRPAAKTTKTTTRSKTKTGTKATTGAKAKDKLQQEGASETVDAGDKPQAKKKKEENVEE